VTIGNYEPEALAFQTNRPKNRTMLTSKQLHLPFFSKSIIDLFNLIYYLANPMMPPKPSTIRGVDFDAQGVINGQSTYEHDILNSYKDEEKPWKKPGWIIYLDKTLFQRICLKELRVIQ
jgi:hypothetical protein